MPANARISRILVVTGLAAGVVLASAPAYAQTSATGTVYLLQGVKGGQMSLWVDGRSVATDAKEKTIVGPLKLSTGKHSIAARLGSGKTVSTPLTVKTGSSTDVIVHLPVDPTQAPLFTTFANDLRPVAKGSARIAVAHTAAVGPADIRVNGKVLFSNVASGEALNLTVPGGTYRVDIVPTTTTGPVVFGPADVPVKSGALNRVFAIGVAATGSMDAIVQVLPLGSSGATPSSVQAGNGGQAQPLIAAAGDATPSPALPLGAGLLIGGALLLSGRSLLLRRRATSG